MSATDIAKDPAGTKEPTMSPNNVNDLASSFVQMAKAFEDLPGVQAEREAIGKLYLEAQETIQSRELAILEYKATIDNLQASVRNLEVARDDAELRFLELDEKAYKVLGDFAAITALVNGATRELNPPKPEPVQTVEVNPFVNEPTPIISEVKPIVEDPILGVSMEPHAPVADTISAGSDAMPTDPDWAQDKAETSTLPPQGQSEADPTAPSEVGKPIVSETANVIGAGQTGDVSSPDPTPKPYAGRRHIDIPHFVSYSDWLAGGGTDEMYYARSEYKA